MKETKKKVVNMQEYKEKSKNIAAKHTQNNIKTANTNTSPTFLIVSLFLINLVKLIINKLIIEQYIIGIIGKVIIPRIPNKKFLKESPRAKKNPITLKNITKSCTKLSAQNIEAIFAPTISRGLSGNGNKFSISPVK